jgi:hypothetical protein
LKKLEEKRKKQQQRRHERKKMELEEGAREEAEQVSKNILTENDEGRRF